MTDNSPDAQSANFQITVVTSMVEMSEKLAEGALNGNLERAFLLTMDREGQLSSCHVGCRLSDVVGMINVFLAATMRKLLV